ncbi:MAG: hypothetical protein JXX28_02080 [Deltaproteobacteria bacterium]|nr:hypothetical protein [Deltaproteobacteria bacterium]
MATPLHDLDVLLALSEDSGEARAWALARLALAAPHKVRAFPAESSLPDIPQMAGWPGMAEQLLAAMRATPNVRLAQAIATLGSYGHLPTQTFTYAADLRALLREDGGPEDLWLILALAQMGEVLLPDLRIADASRDPLREVVLPVAALRVAETLGQLEVAVPEIAAALRRQADDDPGLLGLVLVNLGVPAGQIALPSPREAAIAGALAAGGEPREIRVQGSKKRQAQGWVRGLLAETPGAAAALLREAFREDPPEGWGVGLVAAAGWLAAYQATDPLTDVRLHFAGTDVRTLAAARRAVRPEHRDQLLEDLRTRPDPALGVLAQPLLRGDEELSGAVLDLVMVRRSLDMRALSAACVAAWHCPDRIPDLLRDERTQPLALMVAEWVPTLEVLEALLELPTPAEPSSREQYARTLASMGDPAALPVLQALFAEDRDGSLDAIRDLTRGLLRVDVR